MTNSLSKGIKIKVLYSKNYIQRDLYVLEYKDKYLMVYRSSGLNAGRAGRFLPFEMLAESTRITISGPVPGYIYKEFYFNNTYITHGKHPSKFGSGIAEFLLEIEKFLSDKIPPVIDYNNIKNYAQIIPIAEAINIELTEAIKGLKPYDWKELIKELK